MENKKKNALPIIDDSVKHRKKRMPKAFVKADHKHIYDVPIIHLQNYKDVQLQSIGTACSICGKVGHTKFIMNETVIDGKVYPCFKPYTLDEIKAKFPSHRIIEEPLKK